MKQPMDHLRSQKRPVRKTVVIAGDNVLAEEVSALEEEVRRLRATMELRRGDAEAERTSLLEEKEAVLAVKKQELEEASVKFVFQAIRRDRYDALVSEHPPTDKQREEAEAVGESGLAFNPDTFPIALIVECMVEPSGYDRAEMVDWLSSESWNQSELLTLFQACLLVNTSSSVVSLGKG